MRIWEAAAVVVVAGALCSTLSLDTARSDVPCLNGTGCDGLNDSTATCRDGRHVASSLNCSDLCVNATEGSPCATLDANECLQVLCFEGDCAVRDPYVPASCNDMNPCTIDSCDVCANNCTGACMHMPLVNATMCDLGLGQPCSGGFQCASGFCVEGVCCNTACNARGQSCTRPGLVGQCIGAAAAPALSWLGMAVAFCLLAAVGILALRGSLSR